MAIGLQCMNVIVPLENVRKCLAEDEYQKFVRDNRGGGIFCCDNHLYRESSMGAVDFMVECWEKKGLVRAEKVGGQWHWKDLCVVDMLIGTPYPCDWLEIDLRKGMVCLKGHPPGVEVGRMPRDVEVMGIRPK